MLISKFVLTAISLPLGLYFLQLGIRILASKEYYVRKILKIKDKPVDQAYGERLKWIDNRWAEGGRALALGILLLVIFAFVVYTILK